MNNLLGLEFIKFFHNQTAHLQAEGPRLLHVDCHSSHINLDLLDFAIAHDIIVLGYPPHTTNLTQGLDVVIFAPFKNAYTKWAAKHLAETRKEVEKKDFLRIVHLAVQDSFSEDNLLMAWRKTGLRPVNRLAISDLDLAPSREFSAIHSLPLPPPSPIRAVINAIHRQNQIQDNPPSPPPSPPNQFDDLHISAPCTPPGQSPCHISTLEKEMELSMALNSDSLHPVSAWFSPLRAPDRTSSTNDDPCDEEIFLSLSSQLEHISLDAPFGDCNGIPSAEEIHAINIAGDVLRSIATTSLSPILELETVTSNCELPPIERGPLPNKLVQTLKQHEGMPSEALWNATKNSLINIVPRTERYLAQVVLQETYCQQVQRRLAHKEKPREPTALQKVIGLKKGLIFTDEEVRAALANDAEVREKARAETEQKREQRELKQEAEKWLELALVTQNEEHDRLVAEWKALPAAQRGRRSAPRKPPLATMPQQYKEALAKKKRQPPKRTTRKKVADDDSYCEDNSD
jgi:DDE superfamily endonuclease